MAGPVIRNFASRPWATEAACKGMDPDLFHPVEADRTGPARAVCACCPVKPECLEFALATRQEYGVWGGLDPDERRKLRRRRRR